MAPPPAKRQKRLLILSSDEGEDGDDLPKKKYTKARTTTTTAPVSSTRSQRKPERSASRARSSTSGGSTPVPSPEKKKGSVVKKSKNASLYSFFNATTQSQTQVASRNTSATPSLRAEDDLIEDGFVADGPLGSDLALQKPLQANRITRSQVQNSNGRGLAEVSTWLAPNTRRRFVTGGKEFAGTTARGSISESSDRKPWADKYAPDNLDELAVHKKKVADVRTWLETMMLKRQRKRLLILKGPSGSGKTTVLKLLAKTLGLEIVEWMNPDVTGSPTEGFVSLASQLEDFLGRSDRYGSLQLICNGEQRKTASSPPASQQKIILLEEFPNIFQSASTALLAFRRTVMQFLAADLSTPGAFLTKGTDKGSSITPMIMIISESLVSTSTATSDSFTAHRLLGAEILNHSGVSMIEFNAIAPTLLAKALQLVIQKEARQSGRRRIPGRSLLNKLGEVGDIRSAIGSLEFICLGGDGYSGWSGHVVANGKKDANRAPAMTEMEFEASKMVTQREASLGIFHAVAKVVYNKRDEGPVSTSFQETPEQPSDHLLRHYCNNGQGVFVDELIDATGSDLSTFVAALHENYALSCESQETIETINSCIDALSDSDLLSPRAGDMNTTASRSYQGNGAAESLRQSELCFHVAVRGLLFALPSPVRRRKRAGKGDAYRMLYPTSMRLWKQAEEISDLVSHWTDGFMRGFNLEDSHRPQALASTGVVESWKHKSFAFGVTTSKDTSPDDASSTTSGFSHRLRRTEMVTEILPYFAKIVSGTIGKTRFRELLRIIQFSGIVASMPDEDEEETTKEGSRSTQQHTPMLPMAPARLTGSTLTDEGGDQITTNLASPSGADELVLNYDDIEDD